MVKIGELACNCRHPLLAFVQGREYERLRPFARAIELLLDFSHDEELEPLYEYANQALSRMQFIPNWAASISRYVLPPMLSSLLKTPCMSTQH